MVGSKSTDHHHHRRRLMDGGDCAELEAGSGVACSICLELVSENGVRSTAKLHCGHEFHLDCIGSAFNMKGAMECPNCRKVEKGEWLYANGSTGSIPEFNLEDWIPDEDPFDQSDTEMPFRFQWCPFSSLARLRSSFEEAEFPSAASNGLHGHHSASSVPNSYIAYLRPVPPSSNAADGVDDPNLNHHWNGLSGPNEMFDPRIWGPNAHLVRTFSGHMNGPDLAPVALASERSMHSESDLLARSQSFAHQFMNRADPALVALASGRSTHSDPDLLARSQSFAHQFMNRAYPALVALASQRSTHSEPDMLARSQSFAHQFLSGHGSGPGVGSSIVSSVVPNPNSNARSAETFHISRVVYHGHQPIPGIRRGMPAIAPTLPQPDHGSNFYAFPPGSSGQSVHEPESPWHPAHDSDWLAFHQAPGGNDPGNRPNNFPRHWSWRN